MKYVRTKHKNIHKLGNKYRVRKMVDGTPLSAVLNTLRECKLWLAQFN